MKRKILSDISSTNDEQVPEALKSEHVDECMLLPTIHENLTKRVPCKIGEYGTGHL